MRRLVSLIWGNDLLRGTGLFFVGNMVINFGGFMYHIIMARALEPAKYGILGSLIGLTYFASVPIGALDILVTKGISSLPDDRFVSRTHGFLVYLGNKLKWWLVGLGVVLAAATLSTASFLKLDSVWGVVLVWLMVYVMIFSTAGLATLRALLMFGQAVANQVVGMATRIGLAVVVVLTGATSYLSAQMTIVASMLAAIALLVYQTRFIFASQDIPVEPRQLKLRSLGLTSLVFSGAFTSMYSLDVVLVKHFLSEYWAGIYASLATAGKIVFFALAPISVALLPIVARKVTKHISVRADLLLVAGISLLVGAGIVGVYFLLAPLVVDILFSHRYIEAAVFLPWFGLAILGYSLANILGSFLLAINRMRVVVIALVGVMAEVVLISIFNTHLWQVIGSLLVVFWTLAVILFAYCWYATTPES